MTTAFCVSSASLSGTWLIGQGGIGTHSEVGTFRDNPYSRKLNQILARECRAHGAYLELLRLQVWCGDLLPLESAAEHHARSQRTIVKLIARQSSLPTDASLWRTRLQSVFLQLSTTAPRAVQSRTLGIILDRLEMGLIQAYDEIIPLAPKLDREELDHIRSGAQKLRQEIRQILNRQ